MKWLRIVDGVAIIVLALIGLAGGSLILWGVFYVARGTVRYLLSSEGEGLLAGLTVAALCAVSYRWLAWRRGWK